VSIAVRAAAAFALGQISHPKADENLARFAEDRDPRVREIARKAKQSPASPSPDPPEAEN